MYKTSGKSVSSNRMAAALRAQPKTDQYQFGPWTFTAVKGHILKSEGADRQQFESSLALPQVPEMVFADNVLRVQHEHGFGFEFNPLDALKRVDAEHDLMKVAGSDAWLKARSDSEHIHHVVRPFDWTFSTDYTGTLLGSDAVPILVSENAERIDIEKLKVKEKILFYADVLLYEDELADNGCSSLNVKIRVMPSGFFVLQRFYMRVDDVIIRVNDTRVYHEFGNTFCLREYASRESTFAELMVPPHLYTDPNEISAYLKLKHERIERMDLPIILDLPVSMATENMVE
ncbi:TIP41-like protein [Tubulanus polymorphus]|uniref:TIP41-like protein n=1 Tax=Tubulanus polymorphus TaxID=672921 RepID=UPI003DA21E4F